MWFTLYFLNVDWIEKKLKKNVLKRVKTGKIRSRSVALSYVSG